VRLLGAWLRAQGYDTVLTHEPGATATGERLREVLLGGADLVPRAEALLFAADRAHHVETVVRPALEAGAVVVTDRYIDSSIAYQGAGREMASSEIAKLSRWATQGLVPDLTIVLDVEPALGRLRRGDEQDRLEAEPDDFHARVRDRFRDLARRAPSRYLLVDGDADPEEIAGQVRERLVNLLPESPVAAEARLAREQAQRADAEERERAKAIALEEAERRRREEQARQDLELAGRAAREAAALEAREQAEREAAQRMAAEAQPMTAAPAVPTPARRHAAETTTIPAVEHTAVLPVVEAPRSAPSSGAPASRPTSDGPGPRPTPEVPRSAPTSEVSVADDEQAPPPTRKPPLVDEIFGGRRDHRP
jgi:dTMP kinase